MRDSTARRWGWAGHLTVVALLVLVFALAAPAAAFGLPKTFATGTVTESDGVTPIEGAWIDVWFYDPVGDTYEYADGVETAADGTYSVTDGGYGAGAYDITASADGFVSNAYNGQNWNGGAALVYDFALDPAQVVATGTVTDALTTDPIEYASIDLYWWSEESGEWWWVDWGETDAAGDYTVYDMSLFGAGDCRFEIRAWGYTPQFPEQAWNGTDALTIDAALELAPPLASGTVTAAADGEPIPDAWISAFWWSDEFDEWWWAGGSNTDEFGDYVVLDESTYGAGDYLFTAEAWGYTPAEDERAWDGGDPLVVDFALEPVPPVIPVAGADRFATSVEVSKMAFPEGAEAVVIATGRNWPDALGGTALAGALNGPVLLVEPGSVPKVVMDEITRLGAGEAIILGGKSAVGENVEAALNDKLGADNVDRIDGADRYDTANKVAERVIELTGEEFGGRGFVATGGNFPDALAAAPLAAGVRWPLFLSHPTTGLSAATKAAMEDLDSVVILGGKSAVTEATEGYLEGTFGDENVERLAGDNRYKTAVAVAEYAVDEIGFMWDRVGITTGANFPDALAGGVLQGWYGSVMLLTPADSLDFDVAVALAANADQINQVTFFGGLNAVTQAVRDDVLELLE